MLALLMKRTILPASIRAVIPAAIYVLAPLLLAAGTYWWIAREQSERSSVFARIELPADRVRERYEADVAMAESTLRNNPESPLAFQALAKACFDLGTYLDSRSKPESKSAAIQALLRSVEASGEALKLEPKKASSIVFHSACLTTASIRLSNRGTGEELDQAIDFARKAAELAGSALAPWGDDEGPLSAACLSLEQLGNALIQRRAAADFNEAQDALQRSLSFAERLVALKPGSDEELLNLVRVLHSLGDYFARRGLTGDQNFPPEYYQRAANECETWLKKYSDNANVRRAFADALTKLGDFLAKRDAFGDRADALPFYVRALELRKKALEAQPDSRPEILGVAQAYRRIAEAEDALGRADAARAHWLDCYLRLGDFDRQNGRMSTDDQALYKNLRKRFVEKQK